jgi:hypothetical protein
MPLTFDNTFVIYAVLSPFSVTWVSPISSPNMAHWKKALYFRSAGDRNPLKDRCCDDSRDEGHESRHGGQSKEVSAGETTTTTTTALEGSLMQLYLHDKHRTASHNKENLRRATGKSRPCFCYTSRRSEWSVSVVLESLGN